MYARVTRVPPRDFAFWAKYLPGAITLIITRSYLLSHLFPFDYNLTCRRVKWGEHRTYETLTTPTLFKSPKILCGDIALDSNLLQCWNPPSQATQFTPILSLLPSLTFYGSSPASSARFCNTRISSFRWIVSTHYFHIDYNASCLPPKFCITVLSNFFWVSQSSEEKS